MTKNMRELTLDELEEVSGGNENATVIAGAAVGGYAIAAENALDGGVRLGSTIKSVVNRYGG